MNYNILILVLTMLFSFTACKKDSVTLSNNVFINKTIHQINVIGYKDGLAQTQCSFSLSSNETKSVFTLNNRGIGNGLAFGGYFRYIDSFVVKFDNTYNISHYKPNLIGNNVKYYEFNTNRNLFNEGNFISLITKDEKYRRELDFNYTFIEQDYLDSK